MKDAMAPAAWVWMVDADNVTDAALRRCHGWLSASEAARYERFVRAARQRQFVIGRGLLRMALGRLLGLSPQDVHLEEQIGRAPRLAAGSAQNGLPGLSIAHSGRWVACAVSAHSALGLDIEMKAPGRDLAALAEQAFDAGALARWGAMQALPETGRLDGFYALWSEQEARFKSGLGEAGQCVALPHPELAVVLCSAAPLAAPRIEMVTLP
jgi:4'-phosphopantetheinyl transferase